DHFLKRDNRSGPLPAKRSRNRQAKRNSGNMGRHTCIRRHSTSDIISDSCTPGNHSIQIKGDDEKKFSFY
ncbi:MAG: hypothetical protein ACXWCG_04225, partial [Flavitalea sp.]